MAKGLANIIRLLPVIIELFYGTAHTRTYLKEPGVLRGSPLCTTKVGSYRDKIMLAQIPPASGDAWSIDCSLRCGAYLMTLEGWGNPAHGILDLFLDGRRIGSVDWFNDYTTVRSRSIDFAVRWTGLHQLVGRCSETNADATLDLSERRAPS